MTATDESPAGSPPARRAAFWPALRSPWAIRGAFALVTLVSFWMALERVELVGLGPDPDGDAYGHHVIARELLKNPFNHGKHWVWLPLFHWLQLPLITLGANMHVIRLINVVIWASVPLVLFGYLLRDRLPFGKARPQTQLGDWGELIAATAAGLTLALAPLGMQMGTTAQPEPLFALLLLVFAWGAERERYRLIGVVLTLAVLLRYEAWSVLGFAGLAVLFKIARHYQRERTLHGVKAWIAVLAVPAAAILGWGLLRLPHDSRGFMWFVRGTHDFAQEALLEKNSFQQGGMVLAFDLMRYVWVVPHRTFGIVAALGLLGLWRLWTRHYWLSVASLGVLAFITLGWLMRSTLGLERHFVSVLAWYSALMALGVVHLVELIARGAQSLSRRRHREPAMGLRVGALVFGTIGCAGVVAVVAATAQPWLRDWRHSVVHTFADQLEVARFVDSLPHTPPLFCDEPTVEGLSHVPYHVVQRGSIDWPPVREQIYSAASNNGGTYVVSWLGKLSRLPRQGTVVFRPTATRDVEVGADGHPDKSAGLAVMHFEPLAVQTSLAEPSSGEAATTKPAIAGDGAPSQL